MQKQVFIAKNKHNNKKGTRKKGKVTLAQLLPFFHLSHVAGFQVLPFQRKHLIEEHVIARVSILSMWEMKLFHVHIISGAPGNLPFLPN